MFSLHLAWVIEPINPCIENAVNCLRSRSQKTISLKDSPFLSVLRFPLLKIPHFKDSLFPVPHSYSSIPRSLFKNSQRPETPEKSQNSVLSLVSRFGCFVLRSSFSSASFSMLPTTLGILTTPFSYFSLLSFPQP